VWRATLVALIDTIITRAVVGNIPKHAERDSGAMTPLSYTRFSAVR
jgi:hypothetical protein